MVDTPTALAAQLESRHSASVNTRFRITDAADRISPGPTQRRRHSDGHARPEELDEAGRGSHLWPWLETKKVSALGHKRRAAGQFGKPIHWIGGAVDDAHMHVPLLDVVIGKPPLEIHVPHGGGGLAVLYHEPSDAPLAHPETPPPLP